jgi:hypothetical protein
MRLVLLKWGGLFAAIGLAAVLFYSLRVPQGYGALKGKHEQIRRLQNENADLSREIERKQDRIRKLRESRSEQELEIRRRLKLLREGETSFILGDQEKK